jgi:hypothetical protein
MSQAVEAEGSGLPRGRHGKMTPAVAAAHSASVVVSRWYPNGSCRRGVTNLWHTRA